MKNTDVQQTSSSVHTQLCPTLCDPMYYVCQAPLPMEFSRQEYWNGLPFPSPWDLPDPGIEPMSSESPSLADRFFTTEPIVKPSRVVTEYNI